jgi:hypothetical protein
VAEPVRVDAPQLFEFIGNSGVRTLLISAHRLHTWNPSLSRQLTADHEDLALGTVDFSELLLSNTDGMRYLHQGMQRCGAPSSWGVLPGYCFFKEGQMLSWDGGLPTVNDLEAILRSAIVGVACSGISRDPSFIGQALRLGVEHAAAQRVAARFRHAAAPPRSHARREGAATSPSTDDVFWAYQTLGVMPTASDHEVYRAWRRRRTECHPDRVMDDPVEFERRSRLSADINRARDIIVDYRRGAAA